MKYFIILLLIFLSKATLSCDYYQSEMDCIQNKNFKCRWNEITSQCLYTDGLNFGCSNLLSYQTCISQTYYPDGTLAECIFSGYCRKVTTLLTNCSNNLSRAACLSVQQEYCFWNDINTNQIKTIVAKPFLKLKLATQLQAPQTKFSQQVQKFVAQKQDLQCQVLHQSGAHTVLTALYKSSLLTNLANTYRNLMLIPGCVNPPDIVLQYQSIY